MTTRRINAIYLSGWEYNRILQDEPWAPRNSALPSEILWNGSAQLWLFEKVYCTKEALDNEREAGRLLDWTTGKIFTELADDEERWFEPVDWQKLSDSTKGQLLAKRRDLETIDVRKAITENDVVRLEVVKAELLRPVLTEKNCVLGMAPNSLKNWKLPRSGVPIQQQRHLKSLIEALQKPLVKKYPARDKRLCYPPSPRQEEIQVRREIEAPMIADLLAGDGDFSGPTGYVEYFRRLESHKKHYKNTDDALKRQWKQNKDRLKRLRYLASRHLWNDLHGEWLPELFAEGETFLDEFQRRVDAALKAAPFAEIFDMDSRMVATVAGTAAHGSAQLAGKVAGIEIDPSASLALGSAIGLKTHYHLERAKREYGSLAVFYQKAKNV